MLLAIIALYLLIGVILLFCREGKFVLPYILFLNFYSAWVTDLLFPLEPGQQALFDGVSKYYTYFCFVVLYVTKRRVVKDYSLLYCFAVIVSYFVLLYTFRGIGPIVGLRFAVSTFGSVLFFFMLLYLLPTRQQVKRLIKWNLVIQLIIGGFQFLGFFHFHMNVGETFVGTFFLTGSFTRNNIYAEIISLLLILQCICDYKDLGKRTNMSRFFAFIVLAVVFATGVRTALIADIVILALLFFVLRRNDVASKVKYILGVTLLGVLLFSVYKTANEGAVIQDHEAGNPIERQLNGVREISDRENMEMSTIVLTIVLWDYFTTNPIFGPGM